jgi:hypothetical protein
LITARLLRSRPISRCTVPDSTPSSLANFKMHARRPYRGWLARRDQGDAGRKALGRGCQPRCPTISCACTATALRGTDHHRSMLSSSWAMAPVLWALAPCSCHHPIHCGGLGLRRHGDAPRAPFDGIGDSMCPCRNGMTGSMSASRNRLTCIMQPLLHARFRRGK